MGTLELLRSSWGLEKKYRFPGLDRPPAILLSDKPAGCFLQGRGSWAWQNPQRNWSNDSVGCLLSMCIQNVVFGYCAGIGQRIC